MLCFWYNHNETIVKVFVADDDIYLVIEGMNSLATRKWGEAMRDAGQVLSIQEQSALQQLRTELEGIASVRALIVFGSVARGEATMESDLDVLAVVDHVMSYTEETAAYDAVYRTNLQYDTNISLVIVDSERWESPIWSQLPLYQAVQQEGLLLQ